MDTRRFSFPGFCWGKAQHNYTARQPFSLCGRVFIANIATSATYPVVRLVIPQIVASRLSCGDWSESWQFVFPQAPRPREVSSSHLGLAGFRLTLVRLALGFPTKV
jgi:hypothetical protein